MNGVRFQCGQRCKKSGVTLRQVVCADVSALLKMEIVLITRCTDVSLAPVHANILRQIFDKIRLFTREAKLCVTGKNTNSTRKQHVLMHTNRCSPDCT